MNFDSLLIRIHDSIYQQFEKCNGFLKIEMCVSQDCEENVGSETIYSRIFSELRNLTDFVRLEAILSILDF